MEQEMMRCPTINRMRILPRKIETMKRRIEKDRDALQRIQDDLLYEHTQRGRLMFLEKMIAKRIDRNTEKLDLLKQENMKLRQKMVEAIA